MSANWLRRSFQLNVLFKYGNIALSLLSAILLVPYYLSHLSPGEYGAWLALGALATWFAAMDPGIANLLIQRVSQTNGSRDDEALIGYVAAGILVSSLIAGTVSLCGYGVAPWAVRWLGIPDMDQEKLTTIFRLAVMTTALMILVYALVAVFQGLHDSFAAGILLVLAAISRIVLVVVMLHFGYGLIALPMAGLIASGVALFCSALWLSIRLRRMGAPARLQLNRLRAFSTLFLFSFGARLGKIVTGSLDNVLIAKFVGADQVTAYALTATAPRQSENLVNQPIAALRPGMAHLVGEDSGRTTLERMVQRTLRWTLWGSGLIFAGLLSLNGEFVRLWVGSRHYAGIEISAAFALLFLLRTFTNATGAIGFSLGDIKRNSLAEWAYSLLLIPAALVGVSLGGPLGVVVAHIAVQSLTMAWYFPRTIWRFLRWGADEARHILKELSACSVGVATAYVACPKANSWLEFAAASAVVLGVYVVALGGMSRAFREEVFSWRRRVAVP